MLTKKLYKVLLIGFLLLSFTAQQSEAQGRFDVNLEVKNMHYWRGLRVSNGFVTAPMIGYYNKGFSAFTWAGLSVGGDYREVSQIISYTKNNFQITLLDIFNFTALPDADYFNLKSDETNHITDLSLSYDFKEMLPLKVMLATVVYGNDRNANGSNRYSTYLQLGVPFTKETYVVKPFLAAGFAFQANDDVSLYGNNSFDLVNVGLKVIKVLVFNEISIPVAGTVGFNPSLKQASAEIAIHLF